ncbi:MAG: helix-hairpin-helix domain-containing protein [Bacteroidales bacterium]|nr:helix-hairpin-helix domain-containing protein [Bacteroidales bacterium]
MSGKRIHILVLISFFVCIVYNNCAQELNRSRQKYLEDIVETIAGNSDTELDLTSLFHQLAYYLNHPININSATAEELSDLIFLNDFQIAIILDYREKTGIIYSISELLYLPGIRQQDTDLLHSFVIFDQPDKKVRIEGKMLRNSNHQFIVRYQRVIESQKGFERIPDSILAKDPDKSRYLGSPDKAYFRYRGTYGDFFKTGLIMEKDAGEEFFKGSNRGGFDFYSAFVSYSNEIGPLKNITIGDYLIQWGQGVLLWNGYSFGKSGYSSGIVRRASETKGNVSVDENNFLRGMSMTLGTGRFTWNGFYSQKRIDANLSDSMAGDNSITGFVETGYHRTPSELRKEKTARLTTVGSSFQYHDNRFKTGLNGYLMRIDKTLLESEYLYKTNSFSGKELTGTSMDYKYLAGRIQLFGETAYSTHSVASLNGMFFILKPEIQLSVVHRYYQEKYYSCYASAFGENSSISNENGLFLGAEFQLADFGLRVYGDVFSFPWLKYQVNIPSEGYDVFIEISRKIKRAELYFRYKREEKPKNFPNYEKLTDIRNLFIENYRFNASYHAGDNLRLQNRMELSRTSSDHEKTNYGLLCSQDLIYSLNAVPVEFSIRIAGFNVQEYDARIYSYERDVLYAYTSYMHYGKGWRFIAMAKWEASEFLTFWLRLSQSYYPGNEETGSGLNAINGSHRTEIKIQTVAKF